CLSLPPSLPVADPPNTKHRAAVFDHKLLTQVRNGLLGKLPFRQWMFLFAFAGLIAPTVINSLPCTLEWDEAYYLNRIICTNQAVYNRSWSSLGSCLANTHKGPVMQIVNLPWASTGGKERGIGLAFLGLALFIWVLALVTYSTCLRAGIAPGSLLLS